MVLAALTVLGGCEDPTPPPSASGGNTPLGGLTETPQSLAGKSAAAGRNAARLAEQSQQQTSGLADEMAGKATGTVVGGIEFAVPTAWEKLPASQFQAAQYRISADGTGGAGEGLVVFFANIGGGVESNVNRWRQQVKTEEGSPADAKVEKRTIGGMAATMVSMEGTYTGMAGGGAPAAPLPGASFRAVIYAGPGGDVFARFTGPKDVVEANVKAWETMVLGAHKP